MILELLIFTGSNYEYPHLCAVKISVYIFCIVLFIDNELRLNYI